MNVQGHLTDSDGAPLPAGVKTFTFRIYDAENLGSEIWPGGSGEVQTVTTDAAGLWTANVGALLGLTDVVFADSVRWLEITVDDGVNPLTTLPRVRLMTGTYAYRVSTIDGASGGTITSKVAIGPGHMNTGASTFVAGENNEATGDWSAVGGGRYNFARGEYSVVSGGGGSTDADSNSAFGDRSTIGGGYGNNAGASAATIAGGRFNDATGWSSVVGGGFSNRATGLHSAIGGGARNAAEDSGAVVAGGWFNEASGSFSFVGGGGGVHSGSGNEAYGRRSTIGGGYRNDTYGEYSTIGGGSSNKASEKYSTVGGGYTNEANGESATVAGGALNLAVAEGAAVSGGRNNKARGLYSTICGGGGYSESDSNYAAGEGATVVGGKRNSAIGDYSLVAGVNAHADHNGSFVWSDGDGNAFVSTGVNQFLVKASGGTGIGSDNPGTSTVLEVANGFKPAYVEMIRFQSTNDPTSGDDILVIEATSTAPDDFQFIECERGSSVKIRLWGNGDITADGNITSGGADVAEMVYVSSGVPSVEPGDVMVIDPANSRALIQSTVARSSLVAGVYSGAPGFIASEHDWDQLVTEKGFIASVGADEEAQALPVIDVAAAIGEIPLAVVGIVPCKVTAENGPIKPGDLLVTSSLPGHAMRDANPEIGTVVGKALGTLTTGTGVMDVLVTLQ
jgi:hypothetical protein